MPRNQSRVLCWIHLLSDEVYVQESGMAYGQELRGKSGELLLSTMGSTQFIKASCEVKTRMDSTSVAYRVFIAHRYFIVFVSTMEE
jgi:hypothetical protein